MKQLKNGGQHPRMQRNQAPLLQAMVAMAMGAAVLAGCQANPNDPNSVAGGPAAQAAHDYSQGMTQSMQRGNETADKSNLDQLRTAITMFRDENGRLPNSLDELGPAMKALETCSATGQPVQYNPQTGDVSCPGEKKAVMTQ